MQKKSSLIGTGVSAMLITGALMSMHPVQAAATGVQTNATNALNQKKAMKCHVVDQNGEPLLGVIVKPLSGTGGGSF